MISDNEELMRPMMAGSHSVTEYFEFWVKATQKLAPLVYGSMNAYCIEHQCVFIPTSVYDEYARQAFMLLIRNRKQFHSKLLQSIFGGIEITPGATHQEMLLELFDRGRVMMRAISRSYYYYRSRAVIHISDGVLNVLTKNVDSNLTLPEGVFQNIPFSGCVYSFEEGVRWHPDKNILTKGFLAAWCKDVKGVSLMLMIEDESTNVLVPMQIRIPVRSDIDATIKAMEGQVITSVSDAAEQQADRYDIRNQNYLSKLLSVILFSLSEGSLTPWPDNKSSITRKRSITIENKIQNYWMGRELMCALENEQAQYERENKGKAIHWRRGYYGIRHKNEGSVLVFVRPCIVGLKARAAKEVQA